MGYASALAWVLLLIIAGFTAIAFWTSKYWVHYEGATADEYRRHASADTAARVARCDPRGQGGKRARRSAILRHIFLIAASLVMIYSAAVDARALVSSPTTRSSAQGSLWPSEFRWQNLLPTAGTRMAVSFGTFFRNSLFVTILSVIGNVL